MHYYQKYLNDFFSEFRPEPNYPTYPPYHTGLYLEDYFYKEYSKENFEHIFYIPVSWTTTYIQNQNNNLQEKLNSLDKNKKYFTVCQHDDAPKENLPHDCLIFAAGGNIIKHNTIPIPLACSPIPKNLIKNHVEKKYIASFIGSITHPIRQKVCSFFENKTNYYIKYKSWSESVAKKDLYDFINISQESLYVFCPRGYGLNSFRLYEVFQLNAVPIIITDFFYLPWKDEIDWNRFSILVNEKNISKIEDKINNINEQQYYDLLNNGRKIYNDYFSLSSIYKIIIKKL